MIEMNGKVEDLEEYVYIESHRATPAPSTTASSPSRSPRTRTARLGNGTGLFQTVCSFKIREAYEALKKD